MFLAYSLYSNNEMWQFRSGVVLGVFYRKIRIVSWPMLLSVPSISLPGTTTQICDPHSPTAASRLLKIHKFWQIDLFLSRSFSAIPNWQRAFHVFGSKGTVPAQIQKGPYWHSSYLSQLPRPAVVYFFQAGAPFSIENAKFWLFLHKFTHFLVPLLQAWIVWVWGMPNCILTQCLSRLWTR